jgi:hypothetical protein
MSDLFGNNITTWFYKALVIEQCFEAAWAFGR